MIAEARRWIAAGRGADALRAADAMLARAPRSAGWRMVRGDALRLLGRVEEAADQYDAAVGSGAEAATAGYLAARTRLRRLADPVGALRSLDAGHVDAPGAVMAERGLVLRITALEELGRAADARRAAERYLAEYPDGSVADELRRRFSQ